MSKRLSRGLKRLRELCKRERHRDLQDQHQKLREIMLGHYNYYGRRCNYRALRQYYEAVRIIWKRWLGRRSRNGRITWEKMRAHLKEYPLPKPRIVHGGLGSRSQLSLFGEFI